MINNTKKLLLATILLTQGCSWFQSTEQSLTEWGNRNIGTYDSHFGSGAQQQPTPQAMQQQQIQAQQYQQQVYQQQYQQPNYGQPQQPAGY